MFYGVALNCQSEAVALACACVVLELLYILLDRFCAMRVVIGFRAVSMELRKIGK